MITYFKFVGTTVAGQWTNNQVYPNLGFININDRPYGTLLNDSNAIDVADTASANWVVDHISVPSLVQVYP
jgi:hypothetical protein